MGHNTLDTHLGRGGGQGELRSRYADPQCSARFMDLSIVVPLYNEEDSVTPLYRGIKDALAALGLRHEILFVDDGSRDGTFEVASRLAAADPVLRVIRFRKNYGQTPAMVAGIEHAGGEVIITMDGDLQNDPRDNPLFLEKVREGFDIVVGWRYERQDRLMTRKQLDDRQGHGRPHQGQRLLAQGLPRGDHQEHPAVFGDAPLHPRLGLAGRHARRRDQGQPPRPPVRPIQVRALADVQRSPRPLAHQRGFKVKEVDTPQAQADTFRRVYSPGTYLGYLLDFLTFFLVKFTKKPLRFFGILGSGVFALGFLITLYLIAERLLGGDALANRPALILSSLLIILGIQVLAIGSSARSSSHTPARSRNTRSPRSSINRHRPTELGPHQRHAHTHSYGPRHDLGCRQEHARGRGSGVGRRCDRGVAGAPRV